jgi:hypothetical protein
MFYVIVYILESTWNGIRHQKNGKNKKPTGISFFRDLFFSFPDETGAKITANFNFTRVPFFLLSF